MPNSIRTSLDERFGEQPRTWSAGSGAFAHYELEPGIYDEMFHRDGTPREACRRLGAALERASPEDLVSMQDGVARRFLHEGITFTVLGRAEMSEQIIPIDCVPRILTAEEWDHVDRGLRQRLTALNMFLEDVYHEGHSLRDGRGARGPRAGMSAVPGPDAGTEGPAPGVSVCGTDVVRTRDGFAVLEDNLRVPSGVSYMLACRAAMKQAYPRLYRAHGVREIAQYPEDLYATLASLGSWGRNPVWPC